MVLVSRFAALPQQGQVVFTQSSMAASGDSPVPVGSYLSTSGRSNGSWSSGTATGPHLDFRVFQNGKAINPLSLNSPATDPLDKKFLPAFNALYDKYMAELM